MKKMNERKFIYLILFIDFLMILFAAIIAFGIRFSFTIDELYIHWYIVGLLLIIFTTIIIMYFNKLYDLVYRSWSAQIHRIFNSFAYANMIFFIYSFFNRNVSYSRLVMSYFFVLGLILLIIGRYVSMYIIKDQYKKGKGIKRLICVGITEKSKNVINYISQHKEFGYYIIGYLSDNEELIEYKKLGKIEDFKNIFYQQRVEAVILSSNINGLTKEIIQYCENNYVQAYMIPDMVDLASSPVDIGQISTTPLIRFKEGILSPLELKIKRTFDFIIGLLALIIISPIFLLIMILIKISSKGKIFFLQERYGLNGETIKIIKFRTMIQNAEEVLDKLLKNNPKIREEYYKYRKLKNDPRISKIGKFLRKTSLDELPQLINIIKGDMNIVGPRAMLKDEIESYGEDINLILKVHPGLTGLWQVSGRNNLPFSERVRLDIYYINNWSFWLDIQIIIKTIPIVFNRNGAL